MLAARMNALPAFFVVTYVITWGCWFGADRLEAAVPRTLLFYAGVFTPGLVALGFTARETGRHGLMALLLRLIQWEVPARWYAFALGYLAVIKLAVALLHRAVMGSWPAFGQESWALMFAATIGSTLLGGQGGEELGWRGYALPRMAVRLGPGGAGILLGGLWAGWHLPLFFIPGASLFGQSIPVYFLQVTALSVAMAWLYGHTRGSLFLMMLLHAAVNNTKDIVPSAEANATNPWTLSHSPVAWMTLALLWLCAGWFLRRMPNLPATASPANSRSESTTS